MANLNKYIGDLPDNTTLDGTELFELQKGASGSTGSSQKLTLAALASKIGALIANLFASPAQGEKADSAVQTVTSSNGDIDIDNTDPNNPDLSVGSAIPKYNESGTFTKSQTVSPIINAAATGTVTPDFSLSNTFEYTVTGNLTIANPINTRPGFINILVTENSTGGYTISLGSNFILMNSTAFVTTASKVNILSGYVASNGKIYCNISQ